MTQLTKFITAPPYNSRVQIDNISGAYRQICGFCYGRKHTANYFSPPKNIIIIVISLAIRKISTHRHVAC